MKLDEFLITTGQTGKDFAAKADLHPSIISRVRRGRSEPSHSTERKIAKASKNAVTAADYRED